MTKGRRSVSEWDLCLKAIICISRTSYLARRRVPGTGSGQIAKRIERVNWSCDGVPECYHWREGRAATPQWPGPAIPSGSESRTRSSSGKSPTIRPPRKVILPLFTRQVPSSNDHCLADEPKHIEIPEYRTLVEASGDQAAVGSEPRCPDRTLVPAEEDALHCGSLQVSHPPSLVANDDAPRPYAAPNLGRLRGSLYLKQGCSRRPAPVM